MDSGRFNIQNLEKYSEKLEKCGKYWKEEKQNIQNALEIGLLGLGFLAFGIGGRMEYLNIPRDIPTEWINFGLTTFTIEGIVFDFHSIRALISSLRDKHELEHEIDAINRKLDQHEKSKVRTRTRR